MPILTLRNLIKINGQAQPVEVKTRWVTADILMLNKFPGISIKVLINTKYTQK